MSHRLTRRQALIAVPVLATAACTADRPAARTPVPTTSTATHAGPPAVGDAVLRRSGGAAVIVGTDGPALLQVSRALFEWSSVAVVAADPGPATVRAASQAAQVLGAPFLLATEGLRAELDRLQARTVIAYPTGASLDVGAREVRPAPATPAGLPLLGVTAPLPTTSPADAVPLVLTTATAPASAVVLAALSSAGGTTHEVADTDPRAAAATARLVLGAPDSPVLGVGAPFGGTDRFAARVATVRTAPQLPGGGWVPFPGRRLVALYGSPLTKTLGALGEQGPDATVRRVRSLAAAHAAYTTAPVVPAFELIATVAAGGPGADHNYSNETSVDTLTPWVDAAGRSGVYVVLDLQPGRSDFLSQAKRYEALLRRSYVGLALDPEWRLGPKDKPLQHIGSVDVSEVNAVITWLADLVRANRLPAKVLTLHQFQTRMIRRRQLLDTSHDEVQILVHADGQGSTAAKFATWWALRQGLPAGVWLGWKNFYDEDPHTLTPQQTMTQVHPTPWFVSYQ